VYSYHIFLIHSLVGSYLGCFQSLSIVNSAAVNMSVKVALSYPGVHSFEYVPRSGITGSYGSSIFSCLRELHITFHSSCTNLHYHQQCRNVPFPHILARIFSCVIDDSVLTGERWNFKVVLLCISFVAKDLSSFPCLLAICTSFENCLFSSLLVYSLGS
jgi:hypothetical protein